MDLLEQNVMLAKENIRRIQEEDKQELERIRKEVYATKVDVTANIRKSVAGDEEAGAEARKEGWNWMMNSQSVNVEGAAQMLEELWDKYDTDQSGDMSKDEIKFILMDIAKAKKMQLESTMPKVIKRLREQPDPFEVNKAMLPLVEGEFQSNLVTLSQRMRGQISDEELDFLFSRLDIGVAGEDSDGKVSKEEFCSHGQTVFLAEELSAKKMEDKYMKKTMEEMQKAINEMSHSAH